MKFYILIRLKNFECGLAVDKPLDRQDLILPHIVVLPLGMGLNLSVRLIKGIESILVFINKYPRDHAQHLA